MSKMNFENASKRLRAENWRLTDCELKECYDAALEALEVMPEYKRLKALNKPKRILIEHYETSLGSFELMVCPNCKTSYGGKGVARKRVFCEDCGQRLNWGNYNGGCDEEHKGSY